MSPGSPDSLRHRAAPVNIPPSVSLASNVPARSRVVVKIPSPRPADRACLPTETTEVGSTSKTPPLGPQTPPSSDVQSNSSDAAPTDGKLKTRGRQERNSLSRLLNLTGCPSVVTSSRSFALPPRFESATFDNYEPQLAGQAEALSATRQFVERHSQSTSWPLSWATSVWKRMTGHEPSPPNGLYLVGPPGTGKTHLLAATYNALTPEVSCAFLHSSALFSQTEPPQAFAHRLADRFAVCCLDEMEIDDPANEMRLAAVMNTLSERGVPLLSTSNIEPGEHLSREFSGGRFQRFLQQSFQEQYRIVYVDGADYRRTPEAQPPDERTVGRGWIGPPAPTRQAMTATRASASGPVHWWTFEDLRTATTETAHTSLIDDLTTLEHLFVEGISITNTDDAFRLLRVVDALYLQADAPTLHFTSQQRPEAWFAPEDHNGVAGAVAEKFGRTVSRLHALCAIRQLPADDN